MERAGVRRAIAEKRDRDRALALHLRRQTRASDDRDPAGDNAVGAEHADRKIGDMHRAALALAIAGLSAVELGHHAVEVGALGDAVAMAAMGRNDPVALAKRRTDADRDRLLAYVAVDDAVDFAGEIVGRGALLETPDRQHRPKHAQLHIRRQVQ